jgi:multidrug efflux system membrane fusion protein
MSQRPPISILFATAPHRPQSVAHRAAPAAAVACLLAALVIGGCGKSERGAHGGPPPVPVLAGKVERRTMPVSFRAIGHVEAIETVGIKARVGGELQKVWFEEGRGLFRGAAMFTIDPRPYQAALAQAEAILARDQALLAKAEEDTKRYASLVDQDFVTKEQYAQIVANAAALRAAVAGDQANVETAKLNLAYCTIAAPVTGRTGNLMVKVGNLIKANDDKPMVTINQTSPIYVSFSVPAQLLPAVMERRGGTIAVEASAPEGAAIPSTGALTFVDNQVDAATSTILLKATFPNQDERLWPGQFVDVKVILGEEPDRVVCPAPAVQSGQQGQYVFVVKDDSTVELRAVKVARMDERDAVIEEGLAGGETVVTDGQLRLVPGAAISLMESVGQAGGKS